MAEFRWVEVSIDKSNMGVRRGNMSIFLKRYQLRSEVSCIEALRLERVRRLQLNIHRTVKHYGGLVKVCTEVLHFSVLTKVSLYVHITQAGLKFKILLSLEILGLQAWIMSIENCIVYWNLL